MKDQKGSEGLPDKRVLTPILRGRRKVGAEQQMQEWQAVEDHFASVSPGDIEMALEELRNSEKREHREQAGKVLVAYLLWCCRKQYDWVLRSESGTKRREVMPAPNRPGAAGPTEAPQPDGETEETIAPSGGTPAPKPFGAGRPGVALETYVVEFAKTVCERMASTSADPADVEDEHKLPKWRRPDSAFGWQGMPGQPSFDASWRTTGIVACVEYFARGGFPWKEAKSKAAHRFTLKVSAVQKASQGAVLPYYRSARKHKAPEAEYPERFFMIFARPWPSYGPTIGISGFAWAWGSRNSALWGEDSGWNGRKRPPSSIQRMRPGCGTRLGTIQE
jgi:hypothetical protein